MSVLQALLILYAGLEVPKLIREHIAVFDNVVVRLLLAALVVYLSHHDTTLALLLAIALVVSLQQLNSMKTSPSDSFYGGMEEDMHQEMQQEMQEDAFTNPEEANVLESGGACASNNKFTSAEELIDAQNNTVGEADQNSQVQTWENQQGPQGLSEPNGFDPTRLTASDF